LRRADGETGLKDHPPFDRARVVLRREMRERRSDGDSKAE
jgi:hypothetical protein